MKTEDYFKEGKDNIAWIDPEFKKKFYGIKLKKGKGKLDYQILEKPMTFQEMKNKFNADCVELGDIDLNDKTLLQNGYANFWFVKSKGEVFAVDAGRHSGGWFVGVRRFGDSGRWRVGYHVSFRNLALKNSDSDSDSLEKRVKELEEDMQKIKKFLII